ncbi:nitrate- and nitrite sensing domain-containing protein [Nonomuraea dietziae]|uniref:nitrate- and nitrite sensing domain-containing protein n=1 Tax=Nonomuraea dietziae TaxID=65515 RepID=UPI0031CEAD26
MARSRTIRVKIVGLLLVPLVSMVTLWVIIVAVTAGESLELRSYKERWTNLRQPASKLISELQRERLSSASLVVDRATADEQAEAYTQRARTDTARERFRQLSELSRGSSTPAVRTEIDTVLTQLAHLEGIRGEIDAGLSPILPTIEAYNAISDALFGLQRSVALIDDIPIYEQSRLVINLGYAKELLTREQAIAVGDPGEEERKLFTQLVGNRRFLIDQALAELDAPLREIQVGIITSPAYQRLRIMEEQIIAGHAPADWPTASDALATTIQEAQNSASVLLSERAEPVADAVLVRALVLAGTGLVVVVVSIVISLRMGNRLSRELGTLRQAALEVAESRLPQVVRKLRQGEEVEVPALTVPGRTAEIQGRRQGLRHRPADRRRGGRGRGEAEGGRRPGLPQPGQAQPDTAAPPAHPAGRHAAHRHRPAGAGRPVPPRPPHHQDAPSRRGPDHPVGRRPRAWLAQARPAARRRPRRVRRGGGLHQGERLPHARPLAGGARGGGRHPPDRRTHRERHRLLPSAHRGHRPRRARRPRVRDRGGGQGASG